MGDQLHELRERDCLAMRPDRQLIANNPARSIGTTHRGDLRRKRLTPP